MNMNGIYVDLVFDTLLDVIACKDLKDGMVVQTLGKNNVNDNYGATYKIYKNQKFDILDTYSDNESVETDPGEGGGDTGDSGEIPTDPDTSEGEGEGEGGGSAGAGDETEDTIPEIKYTEVILREDLPAEATYVQLSNNLVAMLIDSSNLYDRFDQVYTKMSSIATQTAQVQDAVNAMHQSLTSNTVIASVEAVDTCGVEIVEFMNGQKAVIVREISSSGRTTDNVEAILSDNIAKINVPLLEFPDLQPVALSLMGITTEKLYLNDNCTIEYDGGHRGVVFTVNRQLSPAIYFYM